jgi:hypothetical protein
VTRGLLARLLTAAGLLVAPVTYTLGTQFVSGTLERGVMIAGLRDRGFEVVPLRELLAAEP